MRRSWVAVFVLIGCGPGSIAVGPTTLGPLGETETETETDTSPSDDSETSSDSTESETEGEDPPDYVGDGCEARLLWTHVDMGGLVEDRAAVLAGLGQGFLLGGRRHTRDADGPFLLAIAGGVTQWISFMHTPSDYPFLSPDVFDLEVDEVGSIYALVRAGTEAQLREYSDVGEFLDPATTLQPGYWYALGHDGEQLVAAGRVEWSGLAENRLTFARFDGLTLDSMIISEIDMLAHDIWVDQGRTWVAGTLGNCGVIGEFDLDGSEVWLAGPDDCSINAPNLGLTSSSNETLVAVGTIEAEKSDGDTVLISTEPVVSGWTRDGEPSFVWRLGPNNLRFGQIVDVLATADGELVSVGWEVDHTEQVDDPPRKPIVYRHDETGQLLTHCELRHADGVAWNAEPRAVERGLGGEVVALVDEASVGPRLLELRF